MDDVRARGFLFAGHRGICAIASTFCYVWTRALGQEERSVQKFKEKATWLSRWFMGFVQLVESKTVGGRIAKASTIAWSPVDGKP